MILDYFKTNSHNLKLIIAPHEIRPQNIEKLRERTGRKTLRYTMPNEFDPKEAQILIIDTIGILSSVYRYGTIAYIGGGFGVGIHNTLEAAVFGMPVIFGPNYQRFQEAVELIGIGAANSISNYDEFNESLHHFIESKDELQRVKNISADYFLKKSGATKTIVEEITLKD